MRLPAVPCELYDDATEQQMIPAHLDQGDTIVVDVEVNAAGQIVITGAERGS